MRINPFPDKGKIWTQRRTWLALIAVLLITTACGSFKRSAYEAFGSRDGWQQPEAVIEKLKIHPGEQIADLGAGGGYFTFRLANATGLDGVVYAVDVDREMIDFLKQKAKENGYKNVIPILAEPGDPKLSQKVDLIFICNTYHHLPDRVNYFMNLKTYLKPGGRVAILDFKGDGWHSTSLQTIKNEMETAGYTRRNKYDFLSKQNFQVFLPKSPLK